MQGFPNKKRWGLWLPRLPFYNCQIRSFSFIHSRVINFIDFPTSSIFHWVSLDFKILNKLSIIKVYCIHLLFFKRSLSLRRNNTISLYSLRRLLNSKRRPASNTPDIYYSSYTRPTLRMVNGEIVVMPQGPPTLTTDSDATSSILLETYKKDKRAIDPSCIANIEESPELPFHIIPQDQVISTLTSGK